MKTPFKIRLITLISLIIVQMVIERSRNTISAQAIVNNQSTIINKIDSLFTLLKTAKADTTLVNTYNELSWEYNRSNPDTALYFGNVALKLAIKANYKKGMANSYNNIGNIHANKGDYDKAIEFYFKSLKIYEELLEQSGNPNSKAYREAQKGMANSYNSIGIIHMDKGDYDLAIEFYFKSLKIREEIGDKNGMSASYNNIGNIHSDKSDYDKAIDFYFKSLKICEELGDKNGMSASYHNIGNIHLYKGDYDKAIDFYFKNLKLLEELGNKQGMATSYNNIGIIHTNKGDYDKAIDFYFKSLKICEEIGAKNGMANSYNNIGIIHKEKGDSQLDKEIQRDEYDKAIDFYFKSLKIREELGNKNGVSGSYNNIGNLYLKQGKPEEAKKQQLLALNISKEIGAKDLMYSAYSSLAQCDSALGNFKGAYEYHKLYSQVHDSVFSKESNDKIAEMGAKYEAEKRELTIQKLEKEKLLQSETLARKEAESKKQRILLFSFLAGFIIILVFSIFLYRLFVQKKLANVILAQQKKEISAQRDEIETQRDLVTEQKEHIEEIHKEVTDSINYAKRIQEAILPVSVAARSVMGEHFVLFRPKDIVSGDFYWTTKINNWLIVAVADCTGHGVPGAFMSMLGISFLNEIVNKKEVTKANQVLNQLRAEIINALQQKGAQGEQKDGMDISLCVINTITMECQWSGANNPLLIIRNNQLSIDNNQLSIDNLSGSADFQNFKNLENLVEIKPDKQPIAIHPEMKDFTNHEIKLQKGDILYLLSDGYQDQFGGTDNKKFKIKQLKELFINIATQPMNEQKNILETTFENWKGDHEQIDDVTILGIKI